MNAVLSKTAIRLCTAAAVAVASASHAQVVVSMWTHADSGPEREAYVESVKAFNAANKDVQIQFAALKPGSYDKEVSAAVAAKKLPCVLDFDGPGVYSHAWAGNIIPLDQFPAIKQIRNNVQRTLIAQGSYNGKLYSLGQYDSGLAIWGNRRLLEKAGVRIPKSVADAWTGEEFETVLRKLKESGVRYPLDMKLNYGVGEWLTYGFAPIVQSFGGDLIDRKTYRSAAGILNGPESVKALQAVQNWVKQGYVNANPKDDKDFTEQRSALSYVGHWAYPDYKKVLGEDLVLIAMPRFGQRVVTGAGSWNWGISAHCKHPEEAARVVAHLMSKEEVLRISNANGAVPALFSAIPESRGYGPGGPLRIYLEQIFGSLALIRPQTPAYPAITKAFYEAVANIVKGADVKAELDQAVQKIEQDIRAHDGYAARARSDSTSAPMVARAAGCAG
jgi:multiple sugar transport system substrate-binding protein